MTCDVVHIVGGGARNALLCQLTADACGLPVLAGPVEATALGNVLVQARAAGAVRGDLAELRKLVRETHELRRLRAPGRRGGVGRGRRPAPVTPMPAVRRATVATFACFGASGFAFASLFARIPAVS